MRNGYRYVVLVLVLAVFMAGCAGKENKAEEKKETMAVEEVKEIEAENELAIADNPLFIAEGIRKLSLMQDEKEILQISYEPKSYEASHEYWKIRIPYGDYAIVDTEAILKLFEQAEALDFEKKESVLEMADTGILESKARLTLEFCQTTKEERVAAAQETAYDKTKSPSYKSQADSTCTLRIGKSNGEGAYYTALESNISNVILMPEEALDSVFGVRPFDLMLKITTSVNVDTVAQVLVETEKGTHKLLKEGDTFLLDKKELEEDTYNQYYTELLSIFVEKEIEDQSKITEEELLRVTYKRNVKGAEDVVVVYHVYDDIYASVNVNGVEKLLVKRQDVESVKSKYMK